MVKFFLDLLKKALVLVVGYILLLVVGLVFFWWTLQSLDREPRAIESGSVLVVDLALNVPDAPASATLSELINRAAGSPSVDSVHLLRLLEVLRNVREDERIERVLLHGNFTPVAYGAGFAALAEIRRELELIRAAGKPVTAYLHGPGLRELYLTSVADEVILNPYSEVNYSGLAITTPFFAGSLEQLGVGVQVYRAGDFKSAVEPFVETRFSEENREQLSEVLEGLWQTIGQPIADSRGFSLAAVSRDGLQGSGIYLAEDAVRMGLVDSVLYYDELLERLNLGSHEGAAPQVTLRRYIRNVFGEDETGDSMFGRSADVNEAKPRIAVVYAEGDIVDGWGTPQNVGGDWLAYELRQLRQDSGIAAVVLRINSPGGSAVASEIIHREVTRLAAEKPVIVSFGSIAASGGYWIATPAHRIFLEPTSLTGSIGVFGLTFHINEVAEKLGITFDQVKTGEFADMLSITRPQTEAEIALFQNIIDRLYEEFLDRVTQGRGISREAAEAAADGRIFLGQRAAGYSLADELGGLRDAIVAAAERAGIPADEVRLREVPGIEPPIYALLRLFDDHEYTGELARMRNQALPEEALIDGYIRRSREVLQTLQRGRSVQARLPFDFVVER